MKVWIISIFVAAILGCWYFYGWKLDHDKKHMEHMSHKDDDKTEQDNG